MLLKDLMDPNLLSDEVAGGWITAKQHPHYRLTIYTYSRRCQYGRRWNPATVNSRGLVVDDRTQEIVARPFPKFFNWEEHDLGYDYAPPLPLGEPFEIYEKMDGSLGIIFHYAGRWLAASKGSFQSEQALWAQDRLCGQWWDQEEGALSSATVGLLPGFTYLCEIIYPENRIVVDYGDIRNLTLLAIYGPDGQDKVIHEGHAADWSPLGPVVKRYSPVAWDKLISGTASNVDPRGNPVTGTDHEGFVLHFFKQDIRVKIKYGEYKRLHKVLTGVNARDVWKALACALLRDTMEPKRLAQTLSCSAEELESLLSVSKPLDGLLENVPDEFDAWVRDTCDGLMQKADALRRTIMDTWGEIRYDFLSRRAAAQQISGYPPLIRAGLFMLMDGKSIEPHVWHSIRPTAETPFRDTDE